MKDQGHSGELIECNKRINRSKANDSEVASNVDFRYQTEVLPVFAVRPAVGPRCCPVTDIYGEESLFVMVFWVFPKEVVTKCVGLLINDFKRRKEGSCFLFHSCPQLRSHNQMAGQNFYPSPGLPSSYSTLQPCWDSGLFLSVSLETVWLTAQDLDCRANPGSFKQSLECSNLLAFFLVGVLKHWSAMKKWYFPIVEKNGVCVVLS